MAKIAFPPLRIFSDNFAVASPLSLVNSLLFRYPSPLIFVTTLSIVEVLELINKICLNNPSKI